MINDDFGLNIKDRDKTQMLRDLTDFLIEQYGKKIKSVLIIDEAQNLSPELLEEIRLLSNLETDKSKLLQIIMVGQPELRKILAKPELRALRQRITVSCHINPLTKRETEKYIYHRLTIAGNSEAVIFEDGDIDLIHNFSRGIPRLINIACDFLLVTAFMDKTKELSLDMVKDVISDLEKENRYWQDEIPERYFDNIRVLQETPKNSGNPEVIPSDSDSYDVEREAVFEMISEKGKMFDSAFDRLKTDVDRLKIEIIKRDSMNMDTKLKDIIKEIREIKSQLPREPKQTTSEIQERGNGDVKTKEDSVKRLWAKLFNKGGKK
jgi:general secretion pathway protein A